MTRSAARVIDALGLLTIAAYGSWFYGFGVLVEDISADLGTGVGVLGAVYGATTLAGGAGAVAVGRLLDRRGPRTVAGVIGPLAAVTYAVSSFVDDGAVFCVVFAVAGGAVSASGFYSFTQPVAMSVRPDDTVRAVTRLTIWGAFASPLMIPLTEVMRDLWGWRGAMRGSSVVLFVAFALVASMMRTVPASSSGPVQPLRSVIRRAASSPFIRWYAGSAMLASAAISSLLVFQVPVMKWAGLTAAAAASLAGARGMLQLVGRLPLVPLVSRFGAWRLQFAARTALVAGAVALWASGNGAAAVTYVIVVGASTGALSAVDGMVSRDVLDGENFATLMSMVGLVGTVGGALGPVVVGLLVQATGSLGMVPAVVVIAASSSSFAHLRSGHLRHSMKSL
jgi:MFS family permease